MTFSSKSQLVRVIYGKYPPSTTDLCSMFWRGMGKLFLLTLLGAFFGLVGSLLAVEFLTNWKEVQMGMALGVGILLIAFSVTEGMKNWDEITSAAEKNDLYKFLKGNYCPKIWIEP